MQANYNPVIGLDGKPTKITVYSTDVTEQRLKASETEGQLAAINKSQAVIEFTLDGRIVNANENFLATVGYSMDEIRGQHHSMFVEPSMRSSNDYRMFWEKLGRGEYDAGQYQRVGKGGKEIWLEASYNPIFDTSGRPFKVVKYATNITAQVHAANALRLSAEQARGVLLAAGKGDLTQRVPMEGKSGEMKALCEGINAMLDSVSEAKQREQQLMAETARIKQGLDVVVTNVMIADADLNVVYVNHSIKEMLVVAESDIRKDVPSFNAAKVIGTNIDTFHKKPSYQRNMLAGMTSTHNAKLVLGGRTFSLILNPINGAANERLGYVVEWKDMTAELAAAARDAERQALERKLADENLRIKNALDNVSSNVMIANNERDIVYMNSSVMAMMVGNEAELRKTLPSFDTRKLIGGSIDQFHKNPAHQMHMLAALRGTHRTQIKVGSLTFALIANPIVNAEGERLGTVVEWKDRTVEVAVENEIAGIVGAAAKIGRASCRERV